MAPETVQNQLVEQIYDAALDPAHWPALLNALAAALGGASTALLVLPPRTGAGSRAFYPGFEQSFVEFHKDYDWYVASSRELPADSAALLVVLDEHARRRFVASELHRDWSSQDRAEAADPELPDEEGVRVLFGLSRPRNAPAYGPEQRTLCDRLLPHLVRAARMHGLRVTADSVERAALEALRGLPLGVMLLDARGRVLRMNEYAEAVTASRDGLSIRENTPRAAGSQEDRELHSALGRCLEPGGPASGAVTLSISRPSGARSLQLRVTPIAREPAELRFEQEVAAAVFVVDPERDLRVDEEDLQRLYGLTPAEAALAGLLVRGHSLNRASELLRISPNTARDRLKRVFAKSSTHRQADLVRIVLTGLAGVRPV